MRYVAGDDLRSLVRREGPLDPARAARIVGQIGGALDAAHAAGLVHRDVKPANVLLGQGDHVYLTDFGLTKHALSDGRRDEARPLGRHARLRRARADPRRAGRRARRRLRARLPPVLHAHRRGRRSSARATRRSCGRTSRSRRRRRPSGAPGVPEAFDAVIARALAKDPERALPVGRRPRPRRGRRGRGRAAWPGATRVVATGAAAPIEIDTRTAAATATRARRRRRCTPRPSASRRGCSPSLPWPSPLVAAVAVGALAMRGEGDDGKREPRRDAAGRRRRAKPDRARRVVEPGSAAAQQRRRRAGGDVWVGSLPQPTACSRSTRPRASSVRGPRPTSASGSPACVPAATRSGRRAPATGSSSSSTPARAEPLGDARRRCRAPATRSPSPTDAVWVAVSQPRARPGRPDPRDRPADRPHPPRRSTCATASAACELSAARLWLLASSHARAGRHRRCATPSRRLHVNLETDTPAT